MKKKLGIIGIVLITILCVFLGIHTRKKNGILVTQIQTNSEESLSYMIETSKQKIIMIDGGSYEDGEHLEEILQSKGGVVEQWFLSVAHPHNFGALQRILEEGEIEIKNIYISFNTIDWYEKHEFEQYSEIVEFFDALETEKMASVVKKVSEGFEILVDNLYISVLKGGNPELEDEQAQWNQSMVLKVNNTYKSMIFMGNIANEGAEKFKDNNLDEIDCDAVQISNNNRQKVKDEIYQKMTPQYVFMPVDSNEKRNAANAYIEQLKQILNFEESYLSCDGDVTVKIW